MPLARRAFLGALTATLAMGPAAARQARILRVNGALTARSYRGLETFLSNSFDTVVGLRLRVDQLEKGIRSSGDDGRFVAYLDGPGAGSEIVANEGFEFRHGAFLIEGFFVVKSGGMHQGIVSLFLDRQLDATVLLADVPVKDIEIDGLDPSISKQD